MIRELKGMHKDMPFVVENLSMEKCIDFRSSWFRLKTHLHVVGRTVELVIYRNPSACLAH